MEKTQKLPWFGLILRALLIAAIGAMHVNLLFLGNGIGYGFFIILALIIYLSYRKKQSEIIRRFQYKTASILSFLLPISAIIYAFTFTGRATVQASGEAAKAGTAIGGFIGGGIVIFIMFIISLSLGIVFHLLSKKVIKAKA